MKTNKTEAPRKMQERWFGFDSNDELNRKTNKSINNLLNLADYYQKKFPKILKKLRTTSA